MFLSITFLSLALSGCGNVSLSKSQMSSNTGVGNTTPTTPLTPATPVINGEPILETEKLTTLIDEQIPSNEMFYNNLDTFTNTAGTDVAVASTYRHGINGQNFEDKVQIQVISASGSVAQINLPQLSSYRWGWKAVNSISPNICYISHAKDNRKEKIMYLVLCNGPIGFKSYVLSLNTNSKILSVALETPEFIYDIAFNNQDELVYLTHSYNISTTLFTYALKRLPTQQTITSVTSNQLNGFSLSNPNIMQNSNGEYFINVLKSASGVNSFALYHFASGSLQSLNLSRNVYSFLQDKDTKRLFYYNFGFSTFTNALFNIDLSTSNEMKHSENNMYIYKYQSLGKGIITKYGMPYGTAKGQAWISYDEGKNFKEIVNAPAQTNEIVRTANNDMYLVGVDQLSANRAVASIHKLKEH